MQELWKVIEEYPDYEVSNQGRVRRLRGQKGAHLMKAMKNDRGYPQVRLTMLPKRATADIHRLVGKAFVANTLNKACINHIDCNPQNNFAENLEWCTQAENIAHSRKLGRYPNHWQGKRSPAAKLSDAQVRAIRQEYESSQISHAKLAEKYGTNKKTITNIINRKFYVYVQ